MKNLMMVWMLMLLGVLAGNARAAYLVNGDFEAGRVGFDSEYVYIASGTFTGQGPGEYAVRANARSFNPLLASFGDHTTGTGLMLIVDGDWPAKVVWSESVDVTPNTLYSLSAWAASTYDTHPAVLSFGANGDALGGEFTLPSSTGAWVEFATTWFSGSSSRANFSLTDINPDAYVSGNDFALDDITLVPAVPEPSSILLLATGLLAICTHSGSSLMRRALKGKQR
jgi:hypothetical protein